MPFAEDLTNFDLIEEHKENIQSLPGGRSAKALAFTLAPTTVRSSGSTPGSTRNLNDAIREEYENELSTSADSDDPLDVYDRYVKWTLSAYPSAQATPESQLRPLLERATKAFQSTNHYKNDPRYLKLWLNYIRFFSDAPRETFAYLARHNIGECLALFYEEFAAWLELAGRWNQADEVFKLGIERDARPAERLVRKFGEFQHRSESRLQRGDEPSSPALPTVRPALATKMDPFALSTPRSVDSQAPRPSSAIGGVPTSRNGKQKLAVFSDSDATPSLLKSGSGETARGWDNIGSIAERKKENVLEARPWTGETLKAGKNLAGPPKMTVFKDESSSRKPSTLPVQNSRYAEQQQVTVPQTGKVERRFVDLAAVYPNDDDSVEMSFEELRAKSRGWLDRDWDAESRPSRALEAVFAPEAPLIDFDEQSMSESARESCGQAEAQSFSRPQLENTVVLDVEPEGKLDRPKKMKVREVKGETQTIKTNLSSPTGPKLRRKTSAEPTMTLHTKAATDDIIDIFNQPLRNVNAMQGPAESDGETDYDDDDYTSAGESTGTGRISGTTSEFGDAEAETKAMVSNEETVAESASPWSDFTASKHVPKLDHALPDEDFGSLIDASNGPSELAVLEYPQSTRELDTEGFEVVTPVSPGSQSEGSRTRYIPVPPENFELPTRVVKDPSLVAQNRLPFMTPIVEKTETSVAALSVCNEKDYFNSKTPSRLENHGHATPDFQEDFLSSPFKEIINEAQPARISRLKIATSEPHDEAVTRIFREPIIKDTKCNPVDALIRTTILESVKPPLMSFSGYHDYRPLNINKGPAMRKFIKALSKPRSGSDRTTASILTPPLLRFPSSLSKAYSIKRELGKGAFAPVYLAEEEGDNTEPNVNNLVAIKCEQPPTPWEFYVMSTLHMRLSPSHRASTSLLRSQAIHLFQDEAYLLESYLDQGTLLDLVNIAKADPTSGSTILDESVAMFFTIELLRTVEAMHSVGILHGDLKADNCLVRLSALFGEANQWTTQYMADGSNGWADKGLCLIDFGRGIDLHAFRPDVQFVADWNTGKQDCVEMREMRPWVWQVDYWGIAGVVHSLLFGKYIEDVAVEERDAVGNKGRKYRIREGLKRYWQTDLWGGLFDLLLNPAANIGEETDGRMPCIHGLRSRRKNMEKWLMEEGSRKNGGLKSHLMKLEERIKERRIK